MRTVRCIDNLVKYLQRKNVEGRIDTNAVKQFRDELNYWHQVLNRILDVIRFLSVRGLAFRGDNEHFGSHQNGKYLGIRELIAKYDSFLDLHIKKFGNKGRGNTSYLSSTICEEFILLMGQRVLNNIISELKSAKFFSISVDSTPDISNEDQLTLIIRYVNSNSPIERFLKFFDIETHTGIGITHIILEFLKKIDVKIEDCRGQSYDNATNMSGKYKGMQAIIKEKSKNAIYIPCCAHSLNLVGQCAVDCCIPATSFFGFVQKLYVFFSSSTKRWKVLTDLLAEGNERGLTVKSLSETRWSARYDAITALMSGYDKIYEALVTLASDDSQKPETKVEAQGLTKSIQTLETSLLTVIWQTILERFHKTTIILQGASMDLNSATALLKGLFVFIQSIRHI